MMQWYTVQTRQPLPVALSYRSTEGHIPICSWKVGDHKVTAEQSTREARAVGILRIPVQ